MTDNRFIEFLIKELKTILSKEENKRTEQENNIIELILYVVRNALYFDN